MKIENRLRKEIQKISGIDPFEKTKKRDVVEARALYIHLLTKYHKVRPYKVSRMLKLNHATVLHSQKNFDIYLRYNKELEGWLYEMLLSQKKGIEMKKQYIKLKLDHLRDEDIMELCNQVRDLYEESIIEKELDEIDTNEG
jgi:hypothetical protein